MKFKNSLKVFVLAGVLSVSSFSFAHEETLKYGVSPDYAPFEYQDSEGRVVGFDIDVMNEICRRLSKKCEPVTGSFDSLIAALNARKFDFINSNMQITQKRARVVDFTVQQYAIATQLVVRKGSGLLPTAESLKGHRVGVLQGTAQETYAKKNWAKQGVEVVSYTEQTLTYADFKSGRLEAILIERPNAYDSLMNTPQGEQFEFAGDVLTDPLLTEGVAYAFRKDDALLPEFNRVFLEMVEDGTFEKLMKPYFQNKEDIVFDRRTLDH